ncbi:MAG: hypothetical protein ABMA26_07125 [Limisphaerales bacterium]
MKRWWFSLILLAGCLATFHLWLLVPPDAIQPVGLAANCALTLLLWRAWTGGYFVNLWDRIFHGLVILDVLLEAYVPLHEGYGFYACAAGFALTAGGYRAWAMRPVAAVCDRRGV